MHSKAIHFNDLDIAYYIAYEPFLTSEQILLNINVIGK